ncbi:PhoH-like protein [Seminavis robusta]|uniref:PhoH-like protein n=1 Tax=Seminavis robusta TaxID=568900 RepID=A0A9N8E441_9STRA|nr:PhoH-like protein [Seminavis robusta]|eukprot:Sro643_g180260.1 PhoH-like protein (400) ;mRNA; f:15863-17062
MTRLLILKRMPLSTQTAGIADLLWVARRCKSSTSEGSGKVPKFVEKELSRALASAGPRGMHSDTLYQNLLKRLGSDATKFKRQYGVPFSQWIRSLPYLQVTKLAEERGGCRIYNVTSNTGLKRGSAGSFHHGDSTESEEEFCKGSHAKLEAMTDNQVHYTEILQSSLPIIVAEGPAGTGKTALACQQAVQQWRTGHVDRIVITRPAVTADEELGYLPGDMQEKLRPYLLPIYDSLQRVGFGPEKIGELLGSGKLEVAPLSFMRGRTFINSYIVADEMQNATVDQLRMVLTRLGSGSRMVVTGDVSQCDLGAHVLSGLTDICHRLERIGHGNPAREQIQLVRLDASDVVRHPAVAAVLSLYGSQSDLLSSNTPKNLDHGMRQLHGFELNGAHQSGDSRFQ